MEVPSAPKRLCVRALYTYSGKTPREINIRKGDVMALLNSSNKV